MNEVKFSCPRCGQHLQCDEQASGREIECPNCHALVVVPAAPEKAVPSPQKSGMTCVPESWPKPEPERSAPSPQKSGMTYVPENWPTPQPKGISLAPTPDPAKPPGEEP